MELSLTWFALVAGLLGWICCVAVTTPPPKNGSDGNASVLPKSVVSTALLFPVVVWLATLPTQPPFSSGQGFGRGFLMGGIAALCAALVIERAMLVLASADRGRSTLAFSAATLSPLFAILPPLGVALLWMRGSIIEAILGIGLGWVGISLILCFGSRVANSSGHGPQRRFLLLTQGSVFAACLCGASGLGVYRDFVSSALPRGTYPAIAVALATAIAIAFLAGALLGEGVNQKIFALSNGKTFSAPTVLTAVFGLILPIGFAYLLGMKLVGDLNLLFVIGLGTLIGYFVWWLIAENANAATESPVLPLPPVAMLIALCGYVFAYQLMQGFGVGLMVLALWPALLLHERQIAEALGNSSTGEEIVQNKEKGATAMVALIGFLVVLLLSRFFAMRFRDELRGTMLTDQYSLFGLLVGAIAPLLVASLAFAAPNHGRASWPAPARFVLAGLLAMALPGALVAVWGVKLLPPFFAGAAIALLGFTNKPKDSSGPLAVVSFVLAMALLCVMWADRLLPLAEASHSSRLHWAIKILCILAVAFPVVDFIAKTMGRPRPPVTATTGGAGTTDTGVDTRSGVS